MVRNLPVSVKDNEKQVKYSHIIFNKSFILYFIPWLMFTLINYTTIPIQAQIYGNPETYTFLAEMEFIITAIVALISGFIADKIGRKRLSIIGFILLGIGYAVIGLASANIPIDAAGTATLENTSILLIGGIAFTVIDGIAWGIFYVLFVFTLWGDLANNKWSDKFYFLGVLPYVSAYLIQLMFTPLLSEISFITVFSFASVFLFIAVLPLIYAPETLPDKLMKDRELKSYIENAKKKATKVKHKNKHHKEETEPEENSAEYEEAKKLAEKYY